jgi:hypothetical protein
MRTSIRIEHTELGRCSSDGLPSCQCDFAVDLEFEADAADGNDRFGWQRGAAQFSRRIGVTSRLLDLSGGDAEPDRGAIEVSPIPSVSVYMRNFNYCIVKSSARGWAAGGISVINSGN